MFISAVTLDMLKWGLMGDWLIKAIQSHAGFIFQLQTLLLAMKTVAAQLLRPC